MEQRHAWCFVFAYVILNSLAEVSAISVLPVGNTILPSRSGVDVPGAIFLMNDVILTDGVLFAYSAYFRNDTKLRFQVWQPDPTGQMKFKLIGETPVIPSVVDSREDVYIESRMTRFCIRVHKGDRLGLFFEKAPGAVAYTFDEDSPSALSHSLNAARNGTPYEIGESVQFDNLTFPYTFSAAAFIDTDLEDYVNSEEPKCIKGLLISYTEDDEDSEEKSSEEDTVIKPAAITDDDDDDDDGFFGDPLVTMGLLLWMLLLTTLVLILLTWMATRGKKKEKEKEKKDEGNPPFGFPAVHYANTMNTSTMGSDGRFETPTGTHTSTMRSNGRPAGVTWSNDSGVESGHMMKDEVVTNYSVDTISDNGPPITPGPDGQSS